MRLSEATVKVHANALFRTLGLSNRTEVALLARQFSIAVDPLPGANSPSWLSIRR